MQFARGRGDEAENQLTLAVREARNLPRKRRVEGAVRAAERNLLDRTMFKARRPVHDSFPMRRSRTLQLRNEGRGETEPEEGAPENYGMHGFAER